MEPASPIPTAIIPAESGAGALGGIQLGALEEATMASLRGDKMIDVRRKIRRKAGDARRRQVNRLRKKAEVRTIVAEGKEYTAPVIECPPPIHCKPLDSQRRWPGTGDGNR